MSFVLALLGGLAAAGLAIWDAHLGHPSAPTWSLPALGVAFCVMLAVGW